MLFRSSYWKFLLTVATRYRHCVGAAMTLAVMGYHLQVITDKLGETVKAGGVETRVMESARGE